MVHIPTFDYVLVYFRFMSAFFPNISQENSLESKNVSYYINVTSTYVGSGETMESCNSTIRRLRCEIVSDCNENNIFTGFEFTWYFDNSSISAKNNGHVIKQGVGSDFQSVDVNVKDFNGSSVCCHVNSTTPTIYHFSDEHCVTILYEFDLPKNNAALERKIPQPPKISPIKLHAGMIQCRSAIIIWKYSDQNETILRPGVEHVLEYKVSRLDWKSATKISIGKQDAVLVQGLTPWSMYHFRYIFKYS